MKDKRCYIYGNILILKRLVLITWLFSIYIYDLLLLVNDASIANYADDVTPYVKGHKISTVVASIERSVNLIHKWLTDKQRNAMRTNAMVCSAQMKWFKLKLILR